MRKIFFRQRINPCLCSIALVLLLLFPAMTLQATPSQERKISGIVTSSADGEPLIGVSVQVKGTSNGTITDFDGKYSLNVRDGETLFFSYVGFLGQEIKVKSQTVINVTLVEDSKTLDEVVVIGYGVQKKKLNTGATVQVKGETISKLNTTNPLQGMQGQTPGVSIISTSGQPGADMKVTIRGLGTIGDAKPLYIIDGIEGDITVLNASDIESIDILKDAASAAIYGSQAANGVVLITTKQGAKGKGQVSFDAYYGVQNVARKVNMLNAEQYKIIMNEQAANTGVPLINFDALGDLADTNWVSQMFKNNAKTENYSLNINGGSETSIYSLSLSYLSQEGIVGGADVSNYERYGFNINTEHKLYENKLKVGQHLNFSWTNNSGIQVGNQYNNTLRGAFAASPLSPVYSDNNKYGSPYNDTSKSTWNVSDGNPYGAMMTSSNNKNASQRIIGDVYAELKPTKSLTFRTVFGINYFSNDFRDFTPLYRFSKDQFNEDHTTINQRTNKGWTMTWTNTASYDFKLGDHALNALIGMEAKRYDGINVNASNWNLLSQFNDFSHAYIDNTLGIAHTDSDGKIVETKGVGGGPEEQTRMLSYFGRIGYNYHETYMFNATLRVDGSSKFMSGHRWGYFPSFSAGWVITNEAFMEKTKNWLDFLKFRVSWGQVGNQNIKTYQYASPIGTSTKVNGDNPAANYIFGTQQGAGQNIKGSYPIRLANPDVKWETSEQTNIGIDARFLNGRLGANADFYIKTTKDWLIEAPILATAGAKPPYINGGNMKNTGVELALNWNDRVGKLNYSIGVNGAYNKNKVGKIPTNDGIVHGQEGSLYANSEEFYRAQNGHASGYFWGYKTAGIFQNQEEIEAWKAAGNGILQKEVKPGDVKFVDVDKNGIIDINDKVDLGNGMPKLTYGFNINLDYKGFDLSIFANGAAGNKIVQSYGGQSNQKGNYTTAILKRWTGEGTSNRIPRVTETNINWLFSDLYLQDGDYLRISNITLGYDFAKLIKWKYISQCRLYASVQNAFTFTKYNGMDPEIGFGNETWVSGVDLGYYPRPRTYLLGENIKF